MARSVYIYKIAAEEPGRNLPHRRLYRRWKDNTKIYPKEMECEDMNWINLAQDGVQ
jgi:hypothetical protein